MEKVKVYTLIGFIIILLTSVFGFIIYKQNQIIENQKSIEANVILQKQLVDGIVRSQNQFASKDDIENFAKQNDLNLKAVQKDLDTLGATVKSVTITIAKSNPQVVEYVPTTSVGKENPTPTIVDTYSYLNKEQRLNVFENFGKLNVPFGTIGFSAWQKDPWSLDIKQREYKLSTVIGVDDSDRQIAYNKFSVVVDGKSYELPITSEIKQTTPDPRFFIWNPRLFLGLSGGIDTSGKSQFGPTVSIALMSYGKTKTSSDFVFLGFGGLLKDHPALEISPVMYNIGQHVPLIKNTFIGPTYTFDTNKTSGFMLGLKVGL